MKECIEREAALDIVTDWCPDDDGSVGKTGDLRGMLDELEAIPAANVVEVDAVFEMLDYTLGDCPCNYSPTDEWLPEVCELQDECPNPKEKYGCWRQFIKHFRSRKMDGGVDDAAD